MFFELEMDDNVMEDFKNQVDAVQSQADMVSLAMKFVFGEYY